MDPWKQHTPEEVAARFNFKPNAVREAARRKHVKYTPLERGRITFTLEQALAVRAYLLGEGPEGAGSGSTARPRVEETTCAAGRAAPTERDAIERERVEEARSAATLAMMRQLRSKLTS